MARDDIELAPGIRIICADCKEVLPDIGLMDAVVTDPPYGLNFMGKKWDYDIPSVEIWQMILECLKPGGHLLAFAGTRTQHRMACAIEDAGFNIRDCIMWHYGSGFPKSLDISKAIDRMAGAERDVVSSRKFSGTARIIGGQGGATAGRTLEAYAEAYAEGKMRDTIFITAPATPEAQQWAGWGTALKPATEIITMARKPLDNCTVAENVLRHGTGGINVDGCRVDCSDIDPRPPTKWETPRGGIFHKSDGLHNVVKSIPQTGRWPANLIHDGSDEVLRLFPATMPSKSGGKSGIDSGLWSGEKQIDRCGHDDNGGSAARFFYTAKASKSDRDDGCEELAEKLKGSNFGNDGPRPHTNADYRYEGRSRNHHPTVKPVNLMRYLCRLITPPKGIILDPFMGSGTTGKAAIREGFKFIGIERDREYLEIARKRIEAELKQGRFDF